MNSLIGGHKGQAVREFKALLRQGALLTQTVDTRRRLVHQMQGHSRPKEIAGKLSAAGDIFSRAFTDASRVSAVPLGISLVIAFIAIGFLFGYLTARLVLAGKLAIADIEAQEAHEKAESNIVQLDSLRAEVSLIETKLAARSAEVRYNVAKEEGTRKRTDGIEPEGEVREALPELTQAYLLLIILAGVNG